MIVTASRDESLRLRVADALRDTRWNSAVTHVASVGESQQLLESSAVPSVIIVGADLGLVGATDIVASAANLRTPPPVLLVAQPDTAVLRGAMRGGVRDVLSPDFTADDLVTAFEDAGVSSQGPPSLPGLTVAVFSTKGGAGTSVIASNLAVRLGERTGRATTLLDLDLASADQAIMHGLSPRWTIQDLADGSVGLDAESLQQVLMDIPGTRSRLLAGPVDPALAEVITGANVAAVIAAIRSESPVAVLDTSSSFDDRTLAALDAADSLVLVSSLDVAALRSLTVSLKTLERLGIESDRITIAVARSDSKSGLTLGDVERAVDRPVDVGIPSTRSVPRSVNEGVPMAISSPRSSVVAAIDELVERVLRHVPDGFSTRSEEQDDEGGGLSGLFPWSRSRGGSSAPATATPLPADRSPSPPPASTPAPTDDGSAAPEEAPEASDVGEDDDEPTIAAEVLSLEDRRADVTPRPVRRRVTRSHVDSDDDEVEATSSEDTDDVDEGEDERAAPPPLEAMPPPIVVEDDEEPRRRRGR